MIRILLFAAVFVCASAFAQEKVPETATGKMEATAPSTSVSPLTVIAGTKFYYQVPGNIRYDIRVDASGKGDFGYWSDGYPTCNGYWPAAATVLPDGKVRVVATLPPDKSDDCGDRGTRTKWWTFTILDGGRRLVSAGGMEFKAR